VASSRRAESGKMAAGQVSIRKCEDFARRTCSRVAGPLGGGSGRPSAGSPRGGLPSVAVGARSKFTVPATALVPGHRDAALGRCRAPGR